MLKRNLKALPFAPLLGLILLALIHGVLMWTGFFCYWKGCESIPANVEKIFVPTPSPSPSANQYVGSADQSPKKKEDSEAEVRALKYSGRLASLFLGMAYLIVCLLAFGVGGGIFYDSIKRKTQNPWAWIVWVVGSLVLAGIVWSWFRVLHMPVLDKLGPNTIDHDVPRITTIVNLLNSFGYVVGLLMSVAVCAVLLRLGDTINLKQLGTRMKSLNSILYVSTLILVVGVFLEKALLQWSVAFIWRDAQVVKAAETFSAGLLAFDGGFYTLVLAVLYLPAAFLVRARARELAGDDPETLKKYGLNVSFAESLPRMFVILGPVLAGPVGELFGRIAK